MTWYSDYYNGVAQFFVSFTFGIILDLIFFRIYKHLDPTEKNKIILAILIVLQIFLLIALVLYTEKIIWKGPINNFFFRIGLLSSQLFLFEYAMKKFINIIYDRRNKLN